MRVKEEWQTTKRTESLSAPLMLIPPRQENKAGKKKKKKITEEEIRINAKIYLALA